MVRRFRPRHVCPALMLGLCGAVGFGAAESVPRSGRAELFPFTLPWNDVSPGVTNLSAWLEKPAGKSGFIVVQDGHLRAGDRRIRLLGVNLCFDACFPQHEDADQIAPRMARFGINCVRFHHMDTAASPHGLLQDDRRTIDPAQLDRLDYLVSRLKANGIYADLNLHVGRNFPGLPVADGGSFDKGLDHFVPQMIELQHEYARDLLAHVNPYTGKRYADEPAVALIEISNEDGLIASGSGATSTLCRRSMSANSPGNGTTGSRRDTRGAAALKAAWNAADRPLSGAELLSNGDFAKGTDRWILEQHDGAQATAAPAKDGPAGGPALRVAVHRPGQESWHVQFGQPGLKVQAGSTYTLSFQARSERARAISALVGQAHEPWNCGVHAGGARQRMAHVQPGPCRPRDGRERARALLGPRPGGRCLRIRGRVIPRRRRHRPPRGRRSRRRRPAAEEGIRRPRSRRPARLDPIPVGDRGALLDRHAPVHPRGPPLQARSWSARRTTSARSPFRRRWTSRTGTPTGNTRTSPEGRGTR